MSRVKIYSTGTSPLCSKTKDLLTKWKIEYLEIRVDKSREGLVEMSEMTNGARTVPQISIDGKWIGGFSDLTELHMDDALDELMA